jgi:hypothetical protein
MARPIKAYEDVAFLKSDACRPVRLQLELLKPEVVMQQEGIRSTIVLFGSARIPAPEDVPALLATAEKAAADAPESAAAAAQLQRVRRLVDLSRYYTVAREFAALVSRESQTRKDCDFVIITGGGGGIMEAGNRGAADVQAKSVGLNISLPFEQQANPYIPPELVFHFHYFSIRKMHFLLRARALCAFPGGFGTADELFETLTLVQTRKIAPMPIVLFGRAFWERLINWQMLADLGLISPEDLEILHFSEDAHEAWAYIREFWRRQSGKNCCT